LYITLSEREDVFEFPLPVTLIKKFLGYVTQENKYESF